MKTLTRLMASASLVAILNGCIGKSPEPERDWRIPTPAKNQTIFMHPDHLNGSTSLGYTLLTDVDGDGTWDVAEKVDAGFTPGSHHRTLTYKRGFGPAQGVGDVQLDFVDAEYFKHYE